MGLASRVFRRSICSKSDQSFQEASAEKTVGGTVSVQIWVGTSFDARAFPSLASIGTRWCTHCHWCASCLLSMGVIGSDPRDEKEICAKGWIESDARFGPVLDIKFAKHTEDTALKLKLHLQTTSWIRIVNGVEKYVREAMPIQEEERASGKPAAKARPTLKPSSTSNWNFIPMEQRKWIDIEVKRSKDPYCFEKSTFIIQLLRHKEVGRAEDAGVPYDRIVEKCKEVLSEDSRYWSDEIKEKLSTVSGIGPRRSG